MNLGVIEVRNFLEIYSKVGMVPKNWQNYLKDRCALKMQVECSRYHYRM